MPVKSRDLERLYTGKLQATLRKGKHKIYTVWDDGKKLAVTEISHAPQDYSDQLLQSVTRQLKVTRQQLQELLDCPMSRSDYVKHVQQQDA